MQKRKIILSLGLILFTFFGSYLSILAIEYKNPTENGIKFFVLDEPNKPYLKKSNFWVESPIFIDGDATGVDAHNWTWVKTQTWFGGGAGNRTHPYIIENITIDGGYSSNCIEIRDSNVYFRIKNCTFYNSIYAGIELSNVQNGTIIDNDFLSIDGDGILLYNCNNNTILNNTLNNDSYSSDVGIHIRYSDNIFVLNNSINGWDEEGIFLSLTHNSIISENIASNNFEGGIRISSSDNCTISNNTANNSDDDGITVYGKDCKIFNNTVNNNDDLGIGISGENCTVFDNRLSNNEIGIELSGSNHTVSGNTMNGCGLQLYNYGTREDLASHKIDNTNKINNKDIFYYKNQNRLKPNDFSNAGQVILVNCNDSLISNLEISDCPIGISLYYCNNNSILKNTVYENSDYGIFLNNCHNNNVSINTVFDHFWGIILISSTNNTVYRNTVADSSSGIYLSGSDNNSVLFNTVRYNYNGIALDYSHNNTISENTIKHNQNGIMLYGVWLFSFVWGCNNNIISYNLIVDNGNGIGFENSHHNLIIGNELLFNGLCYFGLENCIGNIFIDNICVKYSPSGDDDDDDDDDDEPEFFGPILILVGVTSAIGIVGVAVYLIRKRQVKLKR